MKTFWAVLGLVFVATAVAAHFAGDTTEATYNIAWACFCAIQHYGYAAKEGRNS